MGRRALPVAVVIVAALVFPALASAKLFTFGVTAGEIGAKSAKLWAHAEKKGKYLFVVSDSRRFNDLEASKKAKAKPSNDNTLQAKVKGLKPGERYYYEACTPDGRKCSKRGKFETAPKANQPATIRFAFSGDTNGDPLPGETVPFFGPFNVFASMLNERNDFNIHFGDTIYSDSTVGGRPPALTTEEKWVKYRTNLAQPNLTNLRKATGFYSHWDDHEFINDFSLPEDGQAIYDAGVQAFTDYAPVTYSSDTGLYRSFRWGQNLELFFLDERSFRSAKASAGGTCDNPSTNAPDLAPTAPQSVRNVFAAVIPSLANPVSQQCLDTINDPNRTMLGKAQLERFIDEVRSSTAKFKIVMNETPIQQFYGLPYDRWEGYAHERVELLRALEQSNVRNLVFLSTDTHAAFANVVRYRTLNNDSAPSNAPAGPADTPYNDYIAGPVATSPFWDEITEVTGDPNAGELISTAFFKPQPPSGVGMFCAQGGVYNYAEVEVSSSGVTVTYKDQNGQLLQDVNGQPCGPYTIPAQ